MRALAAKQKETLEYIRAFIAQHGWPPTHREMSQHFGVTHYAISERLLWMHKKGAVECAHGRSRGIRVVGPRFIFVAPVRNDRDEVVFPR